MLKLENIYPNHKNHFQIVKKYWEMLPNILRSLFTGLFELSQNEVKKEAALSRQPLF
jgi:hypothetical protein